jgi:nitroreductase
MDFYDVVARRRSTRSFSGGTVETDALKRLVESGTKAPSANNVQPWEFVVVTEKERLARIAEIAPNGQFVRDAAACVIVLCKKDAKYYLEDGCAATENIILAATAEGLDSCWIAGDKKPYGEEIRGLLAAPADLTLVSMIAVGRGKSADEPPLKRPLREVFHRESF